MKGINGKILTFAVSLFIGFLIAINITLNKLPITRDLNAKDYKEAIDQRNKLLKEMEVLKNENYVNKEKIDSYTKPDKKSDAVVKDMLAQTNVYGMLTGTLAVKGPGIVIKIEDGDSNWKKESSYETLSKMFHDNDAAMVLNEIRAAGAEAVALNNHRIIPSTSINCNWAFLGFDDDTTEYAPFYFYVIGDPEQLEVKLTKEGSYLNKLMVRKLKVQIERKDEIVLPSSKQSFDTRFMEVTKIK